MYAMSYFRTEAEALHLAVSDDGLTWDALNGNRPVWESPVGANSVRDPSLIQDANGQFHLFATNGWRADSILHAVSEDLLTWTDARLVPVMAGVENVQNCWAPECFFDADAQVYRVLWSSSVTEPNGPVDWNHRIWSAATTDFQTFSPAQLFFDPGHSVIDATVVRHGDGYLMAYKDERGENAATTQFKAIKVCVADNALGPWRETSEFLTPPLSEGPALFCRAGGWTMLFDLFIADKFGALHSGDGRVWTDISSEVHFPPGPRHASVLEVSDDVGAALRRKTG